MNKSNCSDGKWRENMMCKEEKIPGLLWFRSLGRLHWILDPSGWQHCLCLVEEVVDIMSHFNVNWPLQTERLAVLIYLIPQKKNL